MHAFKSLPHVPPKPDDAQLIGSVGVYCSQRPVDVFLQKRASLEPWFRPEL